MGILMWDKPKKVKTKEQWENDGGFDGGPVGGYLPNMSDEDQARWKAKLVGVKSGHPQVEIRKTTRGAQMLLIVSLGDGYTYKYYKDVKGVNVHIALNGPGQMTFDDMAEMSQAVTEARAALEHWKLTQNGPFGTPA